MELPRVLAVGNVAVRIMHTKYDHLSPLSKSFYPKRKVKPPEVIVEEAPAVEATNGDGVFKNCLIVSMLHMYKESFEEWRKNVIRFSQTRL